MHSRARSQTPLPIVVLLLILIAACGLEVGPPAASTASEPEPTEYVPEDAESSEQAIASVEGNVEAAVDVPWRLEPIANPVAGQPPSWPPIPIVVSIHDAMMQEDPATKLDLGDFCLIDVHQRWNKGIAPPPPYDQVQLHTTISVKPGAVLPINGSRLREIERSDFWPATSDVAANQRTCRRWAGDTCANELAVGASAEYNATFSYNLIPDYYGFGPWVAGDDVDLTVTAVVAKRGYACPVLTTAQSFTLASPKSDRLARINSQLYGISVPLKVHLGEAPLPRFDADWVYGDLHYHSQGTDNEGESGYAYRPTLQAMRAIGLDFLFATDHASASPQTTDIDLIYVDDIPGYPDWAPDVIRDLILDIASGFPIGAQTNSSAVRDLNPQRFRTLRQKLNQPAFGANAEVLKAAPGTNFAPRIFLGAEVDVIPEMSLAEKQAGSINFGNAVKCNWVAACWEVPSEVKTMVEWTSAITCDIANGAVLWEQTSDPGRFLVKDVQGLGERLYARQHMVHLPTDPLRDDAFIASNTGKFGGASWRLKDLLQQEYTTANKGYTFLAHPVDYASGTGTGRIGPDIVPYADVQLKTAFASKHVLGLELWNEDNRIRDGKWEGRAPFGHIMLRHGTFAWDKMLQWGLRPTQTSGLSWLPAGEPRRVFMAGGSDAHGDWNYRREGSNAGTSGRVDTAIGKPRNLVHVSSSRPDTVYDSAGSMVTTIGQTQVTTALSSGEFMVTDGPILRIAIDNNDNGIIDQGDTMMGGLTDAKQLANTSASTVKLIVEWKSTQEFGGMWSIDLYVGVTNDGQDSTLVYAPENHGVYTVGNFPTPKTQTYRDSYGNQRVQLKDSYMKGDGNLHIDVGLNELYAGKRVITLFPGSYPAGKVVDGVPTETCRWVGPCNKPGVTPEQCYYECTSTPAPASDFKFIGPLHVDRFYVRALGKTVVSSSMCWNAPSAQYPTSIKYQNEGECIERLAFTNPIWVRNPVFTATPAPGCASSSDCACDQFCNGGGGLTRGSCVTRVRTGSRCTATEQCDGNSYCASGVCAARTAVGAVCNARTAPCVEGATCTGSVCVAGRGPTCGGGTSPRLP